MAEAGTVTIGVLLDTKAFGAQLRAIADSVDPPTPPDGYPDDEADRIAVALRCIADHLSAGYQAPTGHSIDDHFQPGGFASLNAADLHRAANALRYAP